MGRLEGSEGRRVGSMRRMGGLVGPVSWRSGHCSVVGRWNVGGEVCRTWEPFPLTT